MLPSLRDVASTLAPDAPHLSPLLLRAAFGALLLGPVFAEAASRRVAALSPPASLRAAPAPPASGWRGDF